MNSHEIENAYPRMETTRLVLRALQMEDADFILREWGDPQVTHYMRDEQPLKSRQEAVEMLLPLQSPDQMPDFKWWGIELKEEGQLIGTCGYCRWDKQHHRAEIGYDLWPDYWGKLAENQFALNFYKLSIQPESFAHYRQLLGGMLDHLGSAVCHAD